MASNLKKGFVFLLCGCQGDIDVDSSSGNEDSGERQSGEAVSSSDVSEVTFDNETSEEQESGEFVSSSAVLEVSSENETSEEQESEESVSSLAEVESSAVVQVVDAEKIREALLQYDYWIVVQEQSCPEIYSFLSDGTMKSNGLGFSIPRLPEDYE